MKDFLLSNLSGVTESAEQCEDQPAREVARDVPDIGARDNFNEIVPDDPSFGGHSTNQVRHLRVSYAARCRPRHARRDRRIQTVCIYGDVVALRGGYPPQDFIYPHLVQLFCADEDTSVGAGGIELLFPGAAEASKADLRHARKPGHFGCSAQRTAQAIPDSTDLITPIEVGIDVDDEDGPVSFVGAHHGNRNGMFPAQHNGDGLAFQDLSYDLSHPAGIVLDGTRCRRHVAAIHSLDAPAGE